MEPPNKGHVGTRSFVLYREVSFILRLKCTGIIGVGMSRFVLYREVSYILRLKCTGIIGIGTSRFVLYREVWSVLIYQRFQCILECRGVEGTLSFLPRLLCIHRRKAAVSIY